MTSPIERLPFDLKLQLLETCTEECDILSAHSSCLALARVSKSLYTVYKQSSRRLLERSVRAFVKEGTPDVPHLLLCRILSALPSARLYLSIMDDDERLSGFRLRALAAKSEGYKATRLEEDEMKSMLCTHRRVYKVATSRSFPRPHQNLDEAMHEIYIHQIIRNPAMHWFSLLDGISPRELEYRHIAYEITLDKPVFNHVHVPETTEQDRGVLYKIEVETIRFEMLRLFDLEKMLEYDSATTDQERLLLMQELFQSARRLNDARNMSDYENFSPTFPSISDSEDT